MTHTDCQGIRDGEPFRKGRDCWLCWQAKHAPGAAEPHGGCCDECPEAGGPDPLRTVRLDTPPGAFNPSLIRWQGRLLAAYRTATAGSHIEVAELSGPDYAVGKPVQLELKHAEAPMGREDPRWFTFRDRLHLAFIGVKGKQGPTSVLYARLRDDLTVERVFYPHFEYRAGWEKNWSFFEFNGELYAVYGIAPHVVYRIEGDAAYPAFGQPNPFEWSGGVRRGGASPVLIGSDYVTWFHGAKSVGGVWVYNVGVYGFEARPPFRPTWQTVEPVAWADCKSKPAGSTKSVVFPCGAILEGGKWLVSSGVHDRHCEIAEYDAAEVGAGVVPFPAELARQVKATQSLPGWCPATKARQMAALILREKPAVVVEIGVFGGRSLIPMALALKANGFGTVYGIDPWDTTEACRGTTDPAHKTWWCDEPLDFAEKQFLGAVQTFGVADVVQVVKRPSRDLFGWFVIEPIDVLHIDGNHTEEASTGDVKRYLPRVKSGGWVWMDDTGPGSVWGSQVEKAVGMLEEKCDLVRDYGTYRLYQKR